MEESPNRSHAKNNKEDQETKTGRGNNMDSKEGRRHIKTVEQVQQNSKKKDPQLLVPWETTKILIL